MDSDSSDDEKPRVRNEHQTTNYMSESIQSVVNGFPIKVLNVGSIELPDPKFGVSFILCGSTRSGKTTMLNYLYKKHFEHHISVLMSNSLQSDAYDYLKKRCVNSDFYHPEILKDMYKINHATKNNYEFLAIIDDVPDKREDPEIKRLMTIYRNSRISCVVCAQGLTMMNKLARGNINWVFLGRMNSSAEIERNIKDFLSGHFPSNLKMTEKIKLYQALVADYCWIVLDNINGHIFRTKLLPNQLIGC